MFPSAFAVFTFISYWSSCFFYSYVYNFYLQIFSLFVLSLLSSLLIKTCFYSLFRMLPSVFAAYTFAFLASFILMCVVFSIFHNFSFFFFLLFSLKPVSIRFSWCFLPPLLFSLSCFSCFFYLYVYNLFYISQFFLFFFLLFKLKPISIRFSCLYMTSLTFLFPSQRWHLFPLADVMKTLGHGTSTIDYLKMDIGGSEWQVSNSLGCSWPPNELNIIRILVLNHREF